MGKWGPDRMLLPVGLNSKKFKMEGHRRFSCVNCSHHNRVLEDVHNRKDYLMKIKGSVGEGDATVEAKLNSIKVRSESKAIVNARKISLN